MVHKHTANFISLTRIPAALLLVALYDPSSSPWIFGAIAICCYAILSDVIDGKIARRFKLTSELGYIIDGLADRAFLVAAYLVLSGEGVISTSLEWLLIFREVSQYAVRLTETGWHTTQSPLDRKIARSYTVVVNAILLLNLYFNLVFPNNDKLYFICIANALLLIAALISYSRILPRLAKALKRAADE